MKECIFCKIINGDVSSNKIYEDERFLAFLDINPINIGHTLLIPKNHVDYVFGMTDDLYGDIFETAKYLAPKIQKATGAKRIGLAIEGFAVPHVHVHLVPLNEGGTLDPCLQKRADDEELRIMAENIKKEL